MVKLESHYYLYSVKSPGRTNVTPPPPLPTDLFMWEVGSVRGSVTGCGIVISSALHTVYSSFMMYSIPHRDKPKDI